MRSLGYFGPVLAIICMLPVGICHSEEDATGSGGKIVLYEAPFDTTIPEDQESNTEGLSTLFNTLKKNSDKSSPTTPYMPTAYVPPRPSRRDKEEKKNKNWLLPDTVDQKDDHTTFTGGWLEESMNEMKYQQEQQAEASKESERTYRSPSPFSSESDNYTPFSPALSPNETGFELPTRENEASFIRQKVAQQLEHQQIKSSYSEYKQQSLESTKWNYNTSLPDIDAGNKSALPRTQALLSGLNQSDHHRKSSTTFSPSFNTERTLIQPLFQPTSSFESDTQKRTIYRSTNSKRHSTDARTLQPLKPTQPTGPTQPLQ